MNKPHSANSLLAAVQGGMAEQEEKPAQKPKAKKPAPKKAPAKPSRSNTVLIGGHFRPEVKQQLRMIAAEEGTTGQALLEQALDLLFTKKGKEKISKL